MSKLTELIEELCPDGVEYRPLGELGKRNKGMVITASRMKELHHEGGEVRIFAGGYTIADVDRDDLPGEAVIDVPSIIVKSRGNIGFEYHTRPFTHKNELWSYTLDDPDVDQKFIFYYLQSRVSYFQLKAKSGKLPQIGVRDTDQFSVPTPPLKVQWEIVRVLDAFTDLEQNLVSELELRKKQFDSVRRSVISDSQAAEKKVLRLREAESEGIVTLGRGKVISKKDIAANPGDYPVYSSSGAGNGEFGRYGNYMFDDERISWSVDGGGRLFYRPAHRYSVTNVSGWMTVNISDLQVKYLYYVLLSQWENESFDYTRKAHPSVIREVYAFSIPTIEIQDEVVSKLDSLESLIQSIEQEISLRRKQYEFYRDELLSFAPEED